MNTDYLTQDEIKNKFGIIQNELEKLQSDFQGIVMNENAGIEEIKEILQDKNLIINTIRMHLTSLELDTESTIQTIIKAVQAVKNEKKNNND